MKVSSRLAAVAAVCVLTATACGDGGGELPGPWVRPTSSAPQQGESQPPADPERQPNGVDRLSAAEIRRQALATYARAASMRLRVADDDSAMDLVVDSDGNCRGTISGGGRRMELVRTGGSMWVKGNEAFWEGLVGEDAAAMKAIAGDRYVLAPNDGKNVREVTELCDLDGFRAATDVGERRRTLTKGQATEVRGTPAITVGYTFENGVDGGVLYVATVGEPRLLRVDGAGTKAGSVLLLSDYDEPVNAQAPPPEEVFDLGALEDAVPPGTRV